MMETWREIVAELKEEPLSPEGERPWLHYLADRIEKACKTLEEKIEANQELLKRALAYSDKQDEEIAKLRRALETVMKCENYKDVDRFDILDNYSGILQLKIEQFNCLAKNYNAVREAQLIMKEGAE